MKKLVRFGILASLTAAACGGQTDSAAPPQNAPPPQPMMQPQAVPPPSAFNHPGFFYYSGPQPAPAAPPAYMPAATSRIDQVNLVHLKQAAVQPSRCNVPKEVADGVFVHVDCYPYRRIPIAVKHATPAKLQMMKMGHVRWNNLAALGPSMHTSVGVRGGAPVGAMGGVIGGGATRASDPPQAYPDTVDHRLSGTEGPVKDQGDVGACTAFALSSVMDNALRRAQQNLTTSPEHVWAHYGIPTMEDAAQANVNKGITTFDAWPYSGREACELTRDPTDDCSQTYGVMPNTSSRDATLQQHFKTAEAANNHKLLAFEELEVSPPNLDEITATLASGADLWVAFNIDSSVWVNRRMNNFVIPDWTNPDGGHAVALAGYRNTPQGKQFLVHNSWGPRWGDQGYAWVSQAMVQKWLHLAYKVRTDVDAGSPPVAPTPNAPSPPQPAKPKTDEDCPGNQVIDSTTGMCAGICPDQSRPANGQCSNGPAPAPNPQQLQLPGWPGGFPTIPGLQWPPAPPAPPAPGQPAPNQPAPNQPAPNAPAPSAPAPTAPPAAPSAPAPNAPLQPWTIPSAWPWPVPSALPWGPPPSQ